MTKKNVCTDFFLSVFFFQMDFLNLKSLSSIYIYIFWIIFKVCPLNYDCNHSLFIISLIYMNYKKINNSTNTAVDVYLIHWCSLRCENQLNWLRASERTQIWVLAPSVDRWWRDHSIHVAIKHTHGLWA